MKKFKFLWTLVALPLLASCSHDDLPQTGSNEKEGMEGVYMAVTINPNGDLGTRSQTNGDNSSSGGTEVGTAVENKVKRAMIILAQPINRADTTAYEYISSAVVDPSKSSETGSISPAPTSTANNTYYRNIAKFDKTDLATYYDKNGSTTINVFVVCNPTKSLEDYMETVNSGDSNWINKVFSTVAVNSQGLTESIWDETNGFVMTNVNASSSVRQLPATLAEWSNYTAPNKPFDLSGMNAPGTDGSVDNLTNRGAITVHRMAARFDFRDGSQILKEGSTTETVGNGILGKPFTYSVVNDEIGNNLVSCQIYAMGLVNMNNAQYYFGRVSSNGLSPYNNPAPASGSYKICGAEQQWILNTDEETKAEKPYLSGNYVISTYAQNKFEIIKTVFNNYFQYPFFGEDGKVAIKGAGWDWKYCNEIVSGNPNDNYGTPPSYFKWRYVTENTIPGPADKQVNSQSTGIVFKARMKSGESLNVVRGETQPDKWEAILQKALNYETTDIGDGKLLHTNPDLDPILYSLSGNSLYVTWENVREVALSRAGFDATKGQNQSLDRNTTLYRLVYGTGGVGEIVNDLGAVIYTDGMAEDVTSANALWQIWDDARKAEVEAEANKESNPGAYADAQEAAATAKKNFIEKAVEKGFTLYQSSEDPKTGEWGYYCYYYYWNRHNDNGDASAMGQMEFAVVRNNVYKLAVTKLAILGHPRIPENDPETPDPETPDEKSEVYISVSVRVLPWVVRLNNIEF